MILSIDIETFSPIDLKTAGVYKYAEKVEILLFAYAFDNHPVTVLDLEVDHIPDDVMEALQDPNILKTAWNAAFERACISAYLNIDLPPEQWECTMIRSAMLGLPLSLDEAARVLGVENQKDAIGKSLIRYFCIPCKPTKANGLRLRNTPNHDYKKWSSFMDYCKRDVEAERAVRKRLSFFKIPSQEHALWCLDQRINERGVKVDVPFAETAIKLDINFRERLIDEASKITGLSNPNSVSQLKKWLSDTINDDSSDRAYQQNLEDYAAIEITSLNKTVLPTILELTDNDIVKRIINIRQELSKTSVKKYTAMINAAGSDDRVRGLLQFYGANRTGRWSGRLVQVQNLPRGSFSDIESPRKLVMTGDADMVEICYGAIPDTLSQLIRSAFIPEKGKKFFVSDFSAIEARVIAWLAKEKWRLEVFETHGKIYEASAAAMFKIPIEKVDKEMRQKGKIAELALGYGGGQGALLKMGALEMGLKEEELQPLVDAWRNANLRICSLWRTVETACRDAIESGQKIKINNGISFHTASNFLFLTLPSGRQLSYAKPALEEGQYKSTITYWGVDQTTKRWGKIKTYGGKLVENIVQAIARDCLAEGMMNVAAAGYTIVMSVHDEVVCEDEEGDIEHINELMCEKKPWMDGLPLKAEGFETYYYKK